MDEPQADIDPVARHLERLQCFLRWIEEHRTSAVKHTDPAAVEAEMDYLQASILLARMHLDSLKELLLAGGSIDPGKALPRGLRGT